MRPYRRLIVFSLLIALGACAGSVGRETAVQDSAGRQNVEAESAAGETAGGVSYEA